MLIANKYTYTPLSRQTQEGKRVYLTPDGEKLASVTTILDKTAPADKKIALTNWRNRVGVQKAQEISTESAARGTRMHKFLEDFVLTGELKDPGSNPYSKQSHAMAYSIIKQGLVNVNEVWGVEVPLYYPGLYAGTTDACGLHLNDESIWDYKQTNKPKKEEWIQDYFLQLAAYALAHNKVYGSNIRKGVVLMCVKPQDSATGTDVPVYQEFILSSDKFDYWADCWWTRVETYYRFHA